ncbi:hypothetical protein WJX73_006139 [Symbiochloris irregularis]|uniref:Uncharacterized protein n=1 Tax=Symbiochloris irregularis TaxID=706552 RepID=A0AAW1NSQ5_9CHLO
MTPDILESLGHAVQGLYLDAGQFLSAPPPEVLQKHPDKGRGFLSWRDQVLVAAVRDPMLPTFSSWHKTKDKGIKVDLISGALELTPGRYLDIVEALQPDIFASLGDEIPTEVSSRICQTQHFRFHPMRLWPRRR